MAILSTLLSTSVPRGMWESIIWAFEGATNNYVWAVVLLTVVIRLIWSPLDTYNRRISSKNAAIQAKLQPELQKLQAKYANDKQTLNQKTSELYKRNNYNVMGSCGFMLVFMALNLAIFFTLFAGLNNIASYKIYTNYENLKENYANTLVLTDKNLDKFVQEYDKEKDFQFVIKMEGEQKTIGLYQTRQVEGGEPVLTEIIAPAAYLTLDQIQEQYQGAQPAQVDAEESEGEGEESEEVPINTILNGIIDKFSAKELWSEVVGQEEEEQTVKFTVLDGVTEFAMPMIEQEYDLTKESFAWIENIWIADSPFSNSIFTYSNFPAKSRMAEGEETIYNAFMTDLRANKSRVNGYFILPILTIAISFLSMWLSKRLMGQKGKEGAKQGMIMQFVMPVIMGLFAILYNAVFAIYMLTSQIISTALLPLQQLIVKKLEERSDKKALQKQDNSMDYRRKF